VPVSPPLSLTTIARNPLQRQRSSMLNLLSEKSDAQLLALIARVAALEARSASADPSVQLQYAQAEEKPVSTTALMK
jgi:hypothetical protein